jgi:hypothetical protein
MSMKTVTYANDKCTINLNIFDCPLTSDKQLLDYYPAANIIFIMCKNNPEYDNGINNQYDISKYDGIKKDNPNAKYIRIVNFFTPMSTYFQCDNANISLKNNINMERLLNHHISKICSVEHMLPDRPKIVRAVLIDNKVETNTKLVDP